MTPEMLARYVCMGCKVNTHIINEYYMINNVLWDYVADSNHDGMLCIGCVEARLGRKLTSKDFTTCPLNIQSIELGNRSERLMDRLNNTQSA